MKLPGRHGRPGRYRGRIPSDRLYPELEGEEGPCRRSGERASPGRSEDRRAHERLRPLVPGRAGPTPTPRRIRRAREPVLCLSRLRDSVGSRRQGGRAEPYRTRRHEGGSGPDDEGTTGTLTHRWVRGSPGRTGEGSRCCRRWRTRACRTRSPRSGSTPRPCPRAPARRRRRRLSRSTATR